MFSGLNYLKIKPTLFVDGTTASLSESDIDDESVVISFIWGRDLRPYFFEPTTNFGDTSLAGELRPLFIVSLRSSVIVEDNCSERINFELKLISMC